MVTTHHFFFSHMLIFIQVHSKFKYIIDPKPADNMKSPESRAQRKAIRTHTGVTYKHNTTESSRKDN